MLGVIALCVAFGLLALLVSLSRWLAHRPWAAAGNLAVAVLLLLVAHRLWPPVLHLQTYESMQPRALIAQVHCERTGPSAYRVTLTRLPAGHMQVFEMAGDEWRLDVRTLVWTGPAAQLGLPDSFRLDRLSGRYLHTELASATAPTSAAAPGARPAPARLVPASFALSDEQEAGEDIWAQARTDSRWKAHVDARHAYGPWRPLASGARYDVSMTRAPGQAEAVLDARPANEAAAKAMRYTGDDRIRTKG
ncbi:MAG: hypothetical protein KA760_02760 [Steroidobacteraceae bacterium]|jgi:hypothetical protein|nr:hypothetical protein [Steroidobacteraceae bacterium]MBP9130221.1 hypothetical protein [Steroidobacteraceae bacterium]